ncbi:uncharacterized protein LOC128551327 [Mercenaria mercenaria]|uniref:uncharacterized protein LOC128551327 n=1 Tax=Mercenaria mercenaria TaxID=6596 RepID=UPI00234EEDE1|nr:uncharacterized protein LOC128551327 [Mercenaria mercenaria]
MAVTSSGGNSFDIPYASTSFTAFIPLTVTKALALVDLDLVIGCKVSLCFSGSNDCTAPSCGGKRRKRETDFADSESNTTQAWLYEGFQMQIVNHGNTPTDPSDPDNGVIPTQPGTNDICLDKQDFWAILLSLLLLLLCIAVGFCCFFLFTRRQQRRRKMVEAGRSSFVPTTIASPTTATSVSSLSTSSESQPYFLPRYVAFSVNSSGKKSMLS